MADGVAPPNYSVRLAGAAEKSPARAFHFLYRNSAPLIRTRDAQRLVRGLFSYLSSHDENVPARLLHVHGAALVSDRGDALIAPGVLRQWAPQVERRLKRKGLSFTDAPRVLVDPDRHEVIVPEVGLDVDWSALAELESLAPGGRPDPPVRPGRYPLAGWAFFGQGDSLSRAQAVALGAGLTTDSGDLGMQGTLDALARVMRNIEPTQLDWDDPANLVAPLLALV